MRRNAKHSARGPWDLKRREPTTFEALIRWRHSTRGLLLPIDFIPIAEETGIIIPLGNWFSGEHAWKLPSGQTTWESP
jgi:EAL domain-containing protein (putative c-di-GMP-specific phosphodiesterase class I)